MKQPIYFIHSIITSNYSNLRKEWSVRRVKACNHQGTFNKKPMGSTRIDSRIHTIQCTLKCMLASPLRGCHKRIFMTISKTPFVACLLEARWSRAVNGTYVREGWLIEGVKAQDEEQKYECLSGTYVGTPGADPLHGTPDIRHRKPHEIVPQVLADASIKTRWCYYCRGSLSIIFALLFVPLPSYPVSFSSSSFCPRTWLGTWSIFRGSTAPSNDSLSFFPPACCVSTTPESGMRGHPFLSTYFSGCPARLSLSRFKSIRESWETITGGILRARGTTCFVTAARA